MTIWERSEKLPPILVRLLARHRHGPPLTDLEISQASGLPVHQVFVLSQATSWAGIDLPTMRLFLQACGVDFENRDDMDRVDAYLRCNPTWKFLRKSPFWKTLYEPLIRRWMSSIVETSKRKVNSETA